MPTSQPRRPSGCPRVRECSLRVLVCRLSMLAEPLYRVCPQSAPVSKFRVRVIGRMLVPSTFMTKTSG